MGYINKIRERVRSTSRDIGKGGSVRESDLPLDHQLTFKKDADEEWKYRDGRIYVNDMDAEDLVGYEEKDVRLWCGLSSALGEYKAHLTSRECKKEKDRSNCIAKIDAIQNKVLHNMKSLHDEKVYGLYLSFGDGGVLLNNFNVRAFLAMYHLRPTEKARRFLFGIKAKLMLILTSRNGTSQGDRVQNVVSQLYNEVIDALEISPLEIRRIASSSHDSQL